MTEEEIRNIVRSELTRMISDGEISIQCTKEHTGYGTGRMAVNVRLIIDSQEFGVPYVLGLVEEIDLDQVWSEIDDVSSF